VGRALEDRVRRQVADPCRTSVADAGTQPIEQRLECVLETACRIDLALNALGCPVAVHAVAGIAPVRAWLGRLVRPGEQLVYAAKIVNVSEQGAAIEGTITSRTTQNGQPVELPVGQIEMMFSHIDNNISGMKFPEFNFVFNSQFMELFETYRRELEVKLA